MNNHNPEFEITKRFYFGPNLIRSVKRLTEEICDCKIVKKINRFLIPLYENDSAFKTVNRKDACKGLDLWAESHSVYKILW